jgi:hypothetical protein
MLAPELDGKRLQLLHEAVPGGSRIAALAGRGENAPNLAAMRQVASHEGLTLLPFHAAVPEDYPATLRGNPRRRSQRVANRFRAAIFYQRVQAR